MDLVFLSKLLPVFAFPLSLACLGMAASLLVRSRLRRNLLVVACILALWLPASHWGARGLVRPLERQYEAVAAPEEVGAIVVLGGGTHPPVPPRGFVELNEAGDRLVEAARRFRQGHAGLVVATGGRVWGEGVSEAEDMAAVLDILGVPGEALLLETTSRNTLQNASRTWELLEPRGVRRILLVTSALHMPRARMAFAGAGFDVLPAPTDHWATQGRGQGGPWMLGLLPDAENLAQSTRAIREYLGILYYRLRGVGP